MSLEKCLFRSLAHFLLGWSFFHIELHELLVYIFFEFVFLIFILFYFTILNSFCRTSTWIRDRCKCVPHPEPPPSSLPVPSLWIVSVHQPQASSIMHWTWTGDSFHIWYYTLFRNFLISDLLTAFLWYYTCIFIVYFFFQVHGFYQKKRGKGFCLAILETEAFQIICLLLLLLIIWILFSILYNQKRVILS